MLSYSLQLKIHNASYYYPTRQECSAVESVAACSYILISLRYLFRLLLLRDIADFMTHYAIKMLITRGEFTSKNRSYRERNKRVLIRYLMINQKFIVPEIIVNIDFGSDSFIKVRMLTV